MTGVCAKVSLPTCIPITICPVLGVPGADLRIKVSLPTCIPKMGSLSCSANVSMSSWDAAVVIGSSYSPSDSLTLLGFLSRKVTAGCLCLEGVPGSVLGAMVSLRTRS